MARARVPDIARTLTLFAIAGLAEIGGGWLIWQWLREERPWPLGIVGAAVLIGYGLTHTLQPSAEFGRIYAAYGAFFLLVAMGWGVAIDGFRPDRWDIIGVTIALLGVGIIMFAPRN